VNNEDDEDLDGDGKANHGKNIIAKFFLILLYFNLFSIFPFQRMKISMEMA